MELRKAVTVVIAFYITLNALQNLLDALQSCIKGSHLVLTGQFLNELGLTVFALGALVSDLPDDVVGGLADELDTAGEIHILLHCSGIGSRAALSLWRIVRVLVDDRLLVATALLNRNASRRAGSQNEVEDLKRVRILRGCCCHTKRVSSRESDLRSC